MPTTLNHETKTTPHATPDSDRNSEKARLAGFDSCHVGGPLILEFASIEEFTTGFYAECCYPKIGPDKPHTFLPSFKSAIQIALNLKN